jgi:hypothetical protein
MRDRVRGWLVASALMSAAACGDGNSSSAGPADPDMKPEDRPSEDEDLPPCEVPSEPQALLTYLRSGEYKSFAAESGPHASTGPHGGRVLTYVNDILADSLDAENAEHPRCAASVKELFLGKDEVSGWAVLVKNQERSDRGKGYYWYEILSTQSGRRADYEGQGIDICVGCHSAGLDYFRAPWPLQ